MSNWLTRLVTDGPANRHASRDKNAFSDCHGLFTRMSSWVPTPTRSSYHVLEECSAVEPVHQPNSQSSELHLNLQDDGLGDCMMPRRMQRVFESSATVMSNLRGLTQTGCHRILPSTSSLQGRRRRKPVGALDRVVSIELLAALAPGGPGLRASPTLTPCNPYRASQLRVKLTTQTQSTRTCVWRLRTTSMSRSTPAHCRLHSSPLANQLDGRPSTWTIRRVPTSAWGARDLHLPLSV